MADTLSERLSKRIAAGINAARERLSDMLASTTALNGLADAIRPVLQVTPAPASEFVRMVRNSINQAPQQNNDKEQSVETQPQKTTQRREGTFEINKRSFAQQALEDIGSLGIDAVRAARENSEAVSKVFKKALDTLGFTTETESKAGKRRSIIKSADGRERSPAYRAGVPTQQVGNRSALENAQLANEVRIRKNIRTQGQSDEALTFRPLLHDLSTKNPDGMLGRGWKGIASVVSGMPVPQKYETEHVQMGLTVRGREAYVGAAVARSGSNQKQTMGNMLSYALSHNLSIPARKDGTAWSESSPRDVEMLNALSGRADSPFVAGGKPPFIEGSDILLNDENLMRMSRIDSRLSPASIEASLGEVRQTLVARYDKDIEKAASPEALSMAKSDRAFLDQGGFGSYADAMIAAKRENAAQRAAAFNARQSDLPYQMDTAPFMPDTLHDTASAPVMKPFPVENPSYNDLCDHLGAEENGKKTFNLTPENLAFRMSDPNDPSTLSAVIYIPPEVYVEKGFTPPKTREVTDLSGLPAIPDGTYMAMTPTGASVVNVTDGDVSMPEFTNDSEVENVASNEMDDAPRKSRVSLLSPELTPKRTAL